MELKVIYRKALAASVEELADAEWVSQNVLPGGSGSIAESEGKQALEVRRLIEEIKTARANHDLTEALLSVQGKYTSITAWIAIAALVSAAATCLQLLLLWKQQH